MTVCVYLYTVSLVNMQVTLGNVQFNIYSTIPCLLYHIMLVVRTQDTPVEVQNSNNIQFWKKS